MANKLFSKHILLILLLGAFSIPTYATHTAGMDLFYRWKSDSTYEFTLVFYRNCQGFTAAAPGSLSISARSVSKSTNSSISCSRLPTSGTGVPSLTPPGLFACDSSGFNNNCLEEYVYRGTWKSPVRANDWTFSYQLCCLPNNKAPANVSNGTQYVEASLNNLDFPDAIHKNSSPFWNNRRPNHPGYTTDTVVKPPWISVCESRVVNLDQSVRNYDGDFIKYSMIVPRTNNGANTTYINGYSFSNQLPLKTGTIGIDSLTGQVSFVPGKPTGTGIYLVTFRATEYRNDTTIVGGSPVVKAKKIGHTERQVFIMIEDSAACADNFLGLRDSIGQDTNFVLYTCPNKFFDLKLNIFFKCSSADTNGSFIHLRHPKTNRIIPIKKVVPNNCVTSSNTSSFRVFLDSLISTDTFELMFKTGSDGNSLLTECFSELPSYQDTLKIAFVDGKGNGELYGTYDLANGSHTKTINQKCGLRNFTLYTSEYFEPNSLAQDGSDFEIKNVQNGGSNLVVNSVGLTKIYQNGVRELTLFVDSMSPGAYYIKIKKGTDGNGLLDRCLEEWPGGDSIQLIVDPYRPNLGNDSILCLEDEPFSFIIQLNYFQRYLWNNGNTLSWQRITSPGTYWVRVDNRRECIGMDTIVFTGEYCYTDVATEKGQANVRIFPNPTSGQLDLYLSRAYKETVVDIKNINGALVSSNRYFNEQRIRTGIDASPGIYFIKILTEDGVWVEKVVKE